MKLNIVVKSVSSEPFVIDLDATWLKAIPLPEQIVAITMRRMINALSVMPATSLTIDVARTPPNTMASLTVRGVYSDLRASLAKVQCSAFRGSSCESYADGQGRVTFLYDLSTLELYHATSLKRWIMSREDFLADVAYCQENIALYTNDPAVRQLVLTEMGKKIDRVIDERRLRTGEIEAVARSVAFLDCSEDFLPQQVYNTISPALPEELARKIVIGKGMTQ